MIGQLGIPATTLRPNCFMQNDALYFRDALLGPGFYPFPIGERGVSMVDVGDIADIAAAALLQRERAAQPLPTEVVNVVGPQALTGPGIARIWSELLHKPVAWTGADTAAFEARLAQHAPAWMAMDMRLMLDRFCADGMAATPADVATMTRLLGRSPRAYADFAAQTLAAWRACLKTWTAPALLRRPPWMIRRSLGAAAAPGSATACRRCCFWARARRTAWRPRRWLAFPPTC